MKVRVIINVASRGREICTNNRHKITGSLRGNERREGRSRVLGRERKNGKILADRGAEGGEQ